MVLSQPQVQGALGVPWGGIWLLGCKMGSHGGAEPTLRVCHGGAGPGCPPQHGTGEGDQHPPGAGDSPSGRSSCSGVLLKGFRWAWRKRASRSSDAIATVLLGKGHCLSHPSTGISTGTGTSTGTDTLASTPQHWHWHHHQHLVTSTCTVSPAPTPWHQHNHPITGTNSTSAAPTLSSTPCHGTDTPALALMSHHQH